MDLQTKHMKNENEAKNFLNYQQINSQPSVFSNNISKVVGFLFDMEIKFELISAQRRVDKKNKWNE